ncbi:MAG: hypothetical protein ACUVWJ_05090 [Spirochaetota bacterium]
MMMLAGLQSIPEECIEAAKTVTAQLAAFQSPTKIMWGEISALVVLAIIPVFALALTVQRYLVRGLAMGAVKE